MPSHLIPSHPILQVERFPSFGELSDYGGNGPSLGRLYAEGNGYVRAVDVTWFDLVGLVNSSPQP
jgi:hypothetical protein